MRTGLIIAILVMHIAAATGPARTATTWSPGRAGTRPMTFSDSVRLVVDSSIKLVKTYALHRDRPDWDLVRQDVTTLAQKASKWEDLEPAMSRLFEAVDDHHGWLAVKDDQYQWPRIEPPYLNDAVKEEFAKGNRIVRALLPGGIGYLRIPGMIAGTADYDRLAQRLADSLQALQQEGARKFILDLRLNAGGAMFPMIAGVSSLLGNGAFIGNADSQGRILDMTTLKDGQFSSADGGAATVHLQAGSRTIRRSLVVILTGHGTGSAGECLAVAFKGRKHTWFIGEPTAGATTGNNGHWIIDGQIGIVIAETVIADRRHRSYARNLIPDEWVPGGDDFSGYGQDRKIQAAIRRLEKK